MSIVQPDFLAYEAVLQQLYGEKLDHVPKTSYINSDAVNLGTMSRREAIAKDFKTNLGLTAKYVLGVQLLPFQLVILDMLWKKRFPYLVMTRGGGKTFILAVYACLKALLSPGSKILLIGANFRQSQLIFEYIENFYHTSDLFKQCCSQPSKAPAKWMLRVGDSTITAVPLGHDGATIRGLRATSIIADEFASIPEEVFQVVVRGFAAVAKDPARNAMEYWKSKHMEEKGLTSSEYQSQGNQIILSGTAYYTFNHFFRTKERYEQLILEKTIKEVTGDGGVIERLDYRDYGIIQMPYTALPPGFMDITQIGQAKATMHPLFFAMEYMAEFAGTTGGFFPMLDIENATAGSALKDNNGNLIMLGGETQINPIHEIELEAQSDGVYVLGADPARESDNFAICVIKITRDGLYKVVYADAWNRKEWGYSVRRMRDLIKRFNIQRIAIDKGGGGTTIEDLLKDKNYMEPGELPIFNIEKPEEEGDWYVGQEILQVQDFSEYTWYRAANYSLQGDIHHRRIMFPASYVDEVVYNRFQFRESEINECYDNIQKMRLELAQIERTMKGANREHFDLPEEQIKQAKEKGIVHRKDRYSALLLAAHAARTFHGYGTWQEKTEYVPGFWLH
ncbi:MAG: hypothetical protein MN733_20260 [Nitrososphaera sp.]|nr:hypothetical protein [Nitrososphaera sp.]